MTAGLPAAWATGETILEDRVPDLLDSLAHGPLVCAEGYLFECERRGYLQAGAFVPEVVLDHPEVVEELHREFVHAGSDVVEAFTYYGHREKLRVIGKEDVLEPLNRQALSIAARIARETGTLVAGNLRSPRCRRCVTPRAGESRPSQPRLTPSPAHAMNSATSPLPPWNSACDTSASAAAPGRITSGPWPKRQARRRRRPVIRQTCRSIRSSTQPQTSPTVTARIPPACSRTKARA